MSKISLTRLHEVLSYDPVTGVFTWRVATSNRVKVGAVAGRPDAGGYVIIKVDGRDYKAHHLAWFYVHGEWVNELDHEDTDPANNAIGNLRPSTRSQNCCNRGLQSNNTTGFKGVTFHTGRGKFQAYIKLNGKRRFLGSFDTAEEAAAAYDQAAITLHGAFMRPSAGVAA